MNALELERRARVWEPPALPTLVIAPHPDDESLATGGLIARQSARTAVHVVAVTDGEASHPGHHPEELARIRIGEQEEALRRLSRGGTAPTVERLALPDGRVDGHVDELAHHLGRILPRFGVVVAPWVGDHHCDHVAVGRALARALLELDEGSPAIRLHPLTVRWSLFWAWHHPPAGFERAPLAGLALTSGEQNHKAAAIACHGSQLGDGIGPPVVTPDLLIPVLGCREYYIDQPAVELR